MGYKVQAPVLTVNFTKLLVAFKQAIARKEIIGVISPNGIGFKYALKRFAEKHYLKVVYCDVRQSESIREVLLTLYRNLCNVKFSNLDYRKTTLFDLVRVLNYRLAIGEDCLLCIDKCSNLRPAQLAYFVQFLNDFNKPIGLVFRMTSHYANQLARKEKFREQYQRFQQVVDHWRVLERCSDDEILDIASARVGDQLLLNDLVQFSAGNLSVLEKQIKRIDTMHKKAAINVSV